MALGNIVACNTVSTLATKGKAIENPLCEVTGSGGAPGEGPEGVQHHDGCKGDVAN